MTHALVVAKNNERFLLLFNGWKNNWELAGGMLEPGETLRECAIREMLEEAQKIIFWDGIKDIGYIDEIDKELLKYY
ncbi:NUDIX domain-containing protein [Paenibacillus sp. 2TAF8]|uniref:NUDIX domain-containing protein n=1 Tax=Paenibacillus sp. 2TAF8 TaxID=3233020 RepID=UPI003F9A6B3E